MCTLCVIVCDWLFTEVKVVTNQVALLPIQPTQVGLTVEVVQNETAQAGSSLLKTLLKHVPKEKLLRC